MPALSFQPQLEGLIMIVAIRNEKGFTLVELLIVVAIIGILASIAVPQFAAYRQRAYCVTQNNDLASLAITQEAYFIDKTAYAASVAILSIPTYGFTPSTDDVITITVTPSSQNVTSFFTAVATHPGCGSTSTWDSSKGGLQ